MENIMINFVAVGLGGFIGSVLRYSIGLIPLSTAFFPINTFIINFIGSFLIGCTSQFMILQPDTPRYWLLFVQVGICGGFTTFSTFSLETFDLIQTNQYGMAGLYMAGSIGLCLLAVFLGMAFTKFILG